MKRHAKLLAGSALSALLAAMPAAKAWSRRSASRRWQRRTDVPRALILAQADPQPAEEELLEEASASRASRAELHRTAGATRA